MTSPSCPTTPAFTSAPTTPSTPTGSWRHPLMDEVTRRQAENTFTDASAYKLTKNAIALVASYVLIEMFGKNDIILSVASIFPDAIFSYSIYALWAIRTLFVYNIVDVLLKLLRPADDFSDVALTPDQRKLLGLSPGTLRAASAARPENFVTPPRYTKSTPTSRSASPLPGNTSPTMQRKAALNSQGIGMGGSAMDTPPSPLGSPLRGAGKPGWASPRSPSNGGASSVVPSNRWAYEKGMMARKGLLLPPYLNASNSY
ncbi:NPCC-domain-containing protein [Wilcoxina mikolae CBS 423.85]|nr:NPCC-domain-containing protein [Wilcoxina mikolae CBS 423.85]